jgi:hypothetical protein
MHSSAVGQLGCFHSLTIVNNAAINMDMQMFYLHNQTYIPLDISLRVLFLNYTEVLCLVFFTILHTGFHIACTNLHSHQQYVRVLFSPHLHQHLLLFMFLMIVILTIVRWKLNVVLIWIFFMARNVENFLINKSPGTDIFTAELYQTFNL